MNSESSSQMPAIPPPDSAPRGGYYGRPQPRPQPSFLTTFDDYAASDISRTRDLLKQWEFTARA